MTVIVIENTPYAFLHLGGREYLPLASTLFWKFAAQVPVVVVTNNEFQSQFPVNGQGSLLKGLSYG